VPRIALTALAALTALVLAWPGVFLPTETRAYTVQTVEVSELGFNPAVCRMNREYVRFHNAGATPIRVIRPGVVASDPPLIDTGVLQPGEYSTEIIIPHGGTTVFYDFDRPQHSVTVVTPVWVEHWEPSCTPDPNYTPPQPPCRTNPYCLRLPVLAAD
jgi:hypothetical protein